jgi:hypothetical protein
MRTCRRWPDKGKAFRAAMATGPPAAQRPPLSRVPDVIAVSTAQEAAAIGQGALAASFECCLFL